MEKCNIKQIHDFEDDPCKTCHPETKDEAGKLLENSVIKEYMRGLQKKSAISRTKRDPNTYKKMAKLRWERKDQGDLDIVIQ